MLVRFGLIVYVMFNKRVGVFYVLYNKRVGVFYHNIKHDA